MPPDSFTIKDFIHEAKDDFNSPTTSTFYSQVPLCKQLVNSIEEGLDHDRNGLSKMKKSIKAIYNGGCANSENQILLSESLENLGTNKDKDELIGNAFVKFSFIVKELSALERTLMQNLYNIIMFPVDNMLKGDLKGVKNELKKPIDKALKEYEIKMSKIEKEKKAQAKEAGLIRTEITGAEIAEEMDRERKQLQFQMCEYLIKVNEIETKRSFDLLLHLIEYFNAQCKYFRGGLEAIEQFQSFINELNGQLQQARQKKEDEKRELLDLRNLLKSSSTFDTMSINSSMINDSNDTNPHRRSIGYSLHQLQGNQQYGCYKSGYLLKKSESKMRVKMWQKRKCEVKDGFLYIWHSDESKPPTKINLLTCQIKTCQPNQDDRSVSSLSISANSSSSLKNFGAYFDLVSCNRTYHFQVEDEHDAEAWISVLINNKQGALKKEFDSSTSENVKYSTETALSDFEEKLSEHRKFLIGYIRKLSGNDCCVDCGSTQDPTWLSTNFGVLTCIECSGIHREMGVHVSRIQSLTLDNIGTSQLLIATRMSNNGFNDIMEVKCNSLKPKPNSTMDERNQFIRKKYLQKKYIIKTCTSDLELLKDLELAICSKDLYLLLQVWAEGVNLSSALPSSSFAETALHQAIMREYNRRSLHIVDFLIQNSPNLDATTVPDGNTALHYCVIYNQSDCMKLLLRSKANFSLRNKNGKSPMDLAKDEQNSYLIKLLECAEKNQKSIFENIIFDINVYPEDPSTDFSDDDLEDKNYTNKIDDLHVRSTDVKIPNELFASNRLRSSSRKYSFKSSTENEIDLPESNLLSKLSILPSSQTSNSCPPNVVGGDFHVTNIDTNSSKLSSFRPKNTDYEQRCPISNSREASRNRIRLSTDQTFNKPDTEKTVDNEKFLAVNRPSFAGHSRAASADISASTENMFSSIMKTSTKTGYHMRNNSVDNSLVSSAFPTSTVKPSPNVSSLTSNKPAVPTKPSGIVSVFVPGSNTAAVPPPVPCSDIRNLGNVHPGRTLLNDFSNNSSLGTYPVPPPRKKFQDTHENITKYRRCVALYDCEADQTDEISFKAGEIITVLNEKTTDEEWMEGLIENDPSRRGLFPAIFVKFID